MYHYKKMRDGVLVGIRSISCQQPAGENLIEITAEEIPAVQAEIEANRPAPTYADLRRAEYPSREEIDVALWELVVENRPEAAEALQIKRLVVKERIPKT